MKHRLILDIWGYKDDFNPNVLTELLNINPNKIIIKGEMGPVKIRNYSGWQYELASNESEIDELFSNLIYTFSQKLEILNNLAKQYELNIQISYVFLVADNIIPPLFLNRHMIDFLHSINATIDYDGYIDN
jgi:hypothetical protein